MERELASAGRCAGGDVPADQHQAFLAERQNGLCLLGEAKKSLCRHRLSLPGMRLKYLFLLAIVPKPAAMRPGFGFVAAQLAKPSHRFNSTDIRSAMAASAKLELMPSSSACS
jgi:hypothetical protein